jgi:hypothetical protein
LRADHPRNLVIFPRRFALRTAFDDYAAGIEAKMNGLPVGDRYLELLRASLDGMRATIDQRRQPP